VQSLFGRIAEFPIFKINSDSISCLKSFVHISEYVFIRMCNRVQFSSLAIVFENTQFKSCNLHDLEKRLKEKPLTIDERK
jgi:hypothetical protein